VWDSSPRAARGARFQSNVLTTRLRVGILIGNQNWSKQSRSGDVQPEIKLPWPEVENAELKKELKLKVDAEVELKVEVELTRERLREMQGSVEIMMERLVEGNELRFQQEIGAEREYRRELEARLDALDKVGRTSADNGLKVRELELREREFELAERKHAERKAAEDDNAAAFECCLSISDPAGDVLCVFSMLRPLDDHLRNEKRSVTTVVGLLSDLIRWRRAPSCAGSCSWRTLRIILPSSCCRGLRMCSSRSTRY
jgi:hypothetical protein